MNLVGWIIMIKEGLWSIYVFHNQLNY